MKRLIIVAVAVISMSAFADVPLARDCHAGRGAASFRSKADPQLDIPEKVRIGLARGSEKVAINKTVSIS